MEHVRPTILCSKCLGFEKCRYNGDVITAPFIHKLTEFCDMITVCPEVEIGLGVPRKPIRIVKENDALRLVQSETGLDLSDEMDRFCEDFLAGLDDVDGVILKYKSPSCGVHSARYHAPGEKKGTAGRGPGFFGRALLEKHPDYPIETEMRLTNFTLREHFLLKLFTFARFSRIRQRTTARSLIDFQATNKLLLLAYNQKLMRQMGRVVAGQKSAGLPETVSAYETLLLKALRQSPPHNAHINVLQHAAGYFSEGLSGKERNYLNNLIESYRNHTIPLSAVRSVIRSHIIRFGIDYLRDQTYFNPYPDQLMEVTDSGKGRDLRR